MCSVTVVCKPPGNISAKRSFVVQTMCNYSVSRRAGRGVVARFPPSWWPDYRSPVEFDLLWAPKTSNSLKTGRQQPAGRLRSQGGDKSSNFSSYLPQNYIKSVRCVTPTSNCHHPVCGLAGSRPPALQIKISNPNLFLLPSFAFVRSRVSLRRRSFPSISPTWREREGGSIGFPHSMTAEGGPYARAGFCIVWVVDHIKFAQNILEQCIKVIMHITFEGGRLPLEHLRKFFDRLDLFQWTKLTIEQGTWYLGRSIWCSPLTNINCAGNFFFPNYTRWLDFWIPPLPSSSLLLL